MASLRRREDRHRQGRSTRDSDPESDEEFSGPRDAPAPDDSSLDGRGEGVRRRLSLDSQREDRDVQEMPPIPGQRSRLTRYSTAPGTGPADSLTDNGRTSSEGAGPDENGSAENGPTESSMSDAPLPAPPVVLPAGPSSTRLPLSQESVAVRRGRLLEELGPDGSADLRERAAQIVRRVTFGLADNETTTSGYPNRAIGSNLSTSEQMRILLPGDPFRPLQDVADALLVGGPEQAEQVAHGLRAQVQREFGQPLRPPAPDLDAADPNRADAGQMAALDRLHRYARWTPPNGDCWFTSVLRAARELPEPPPAVADIDVHDPTALRALIHDRLVNTPEWVELLTLSQGESEYQSFLGDLVTPGRYGNQMFDFVFDMAAEFLGMRIVVLDRDGLRHDFGNGPEIYLVHNGNHYMPALPDRRPGPSALDAIDVAAQIDVVLPPAPVRFGYLAYRWLSGDVSSVGLTEVDLSVEEREQAASVSTRPLEAQAAMAAEHLARALPAARVDEPVETMPVVQPGGTRIWLAADNGVARAVYVEPNGEYRLFDPSADPAVQVILAWDFPARVGERRHQYVVAAPPPQTDPQVSISTDTEPAGPERDEHSSEKP
jgi:hypothetical protein